MNTKKSLPDPVVFCDFDGTITLADVTDEILSRMAAPEWREIEQMWAQGRIGSRECLERQLALVCTTPQALNELVDSIPVDPYFGQFLRFIRKNCIPFVVVSDGLDYVIRRVLARCGAHGQLRNGTDFFSSSVSLKAGSLSVEFPHALPSCIHGCATCKSLLMRALRGQHWPVVYVGDGLSDRHAVWEADWVFARRPLFDYCAAKGVPCRFFEKFSDIQRALAELLSGRRKPVLEARIPAIGSQLASREP